MAGASRWSCFRRSFRPWVGPFHAITRTRSISTPCAQALRRWWRPGRVGEVLAIRDAGAYGFTESMPLFLSRPMPAEVILDAADHERGSELARAPRLVGLARPSGSRVFGV